MKRCSLLINTQSEKQSSVSITEESPWERLLISSASAERGHKIVVDTYALRKITWHFS